MIGAQAVLAATCWLSTIWRAYGARHQVLDHDNVSDAADLPESESGILDSLYGGIASAFGTEKATKACAEEVPGAEYRSTLKPETCKCKRGAYVSGDDPKCYSISRSGRYFKPGSFTGLGCGCVDFTPTQNVADLEYTGEGFFNAKVKVGQWVFDCKFTGLNETGGDVMFLHGFPEWNTMYTPVMIKFAANGYRSVACNQRGYSLGANPSNEEDYDYDKLRDDIFNVADAIGFDKFHLVTHDHGSVLGWYAAGSERGKQRFLSFAASSIPHPDAFSEGLFGENADAEQQKASQYFNMFVLPNSATRSGYALALVLGMSFSTNEQFQHALWWYNGAFSRGVLSGVPFYDAAVLNAPDGNPTMATLRWALDEVPPLWEGKKDGFPQKTPTGDITMPAMYVCGSTDTSILCNRPYALKTKDYCKGGYTYVEVNCGHDILSCTDSKETAKVEDAFLHHVQAAR